MLEWREAIATVIALFIEYDRCLFIGFIKEFPVDVSGPPPTSAIGLSPAHTKHGKGKATHYHSKGKHAPSSTVNDLD
jgi:hypothetical protein